RLMQAEFPETIWRACWKQIVNDRPAAEVARELGISVNSAYLAARGCWPGCGRDRQASPAEAPSTSGGAKILPRPAERPKGRHKPEAPATGNVMPPCRWRFGLVSRGQRRSRNGSAGTTQARSASDRDT